MRCGRVGREEWCDMVWIRKAEEQFQCLGKGTESQEWKEARITWAVVNTGKVKHAWVHVCESMSVNDEEVLE